MVGGCHKICSMGHRGEGGDFFCYLSVTILSIMNLKYPYKTQTNKARMLIFFCEGYLSWWEDAIKFAAFYPY